MLGCPDGCVFHAEVVVLADRPHIFVESNADVVVPFGTIDEQRCLLGDLEVCPGEEPK